MKSIKFIDTDGTIIYTDTGDINGKYHRENGPALEYPGGDKFWYLNGKLHREDGPAVEYTNGDKYWYLNGKLHREDGPAIEYAYGRKVWYLNDIKIDVKDNDEFLRIVKLMAFM
jgi:hypothetical protein